MTIAFNLMPTNLRDPGSYMEIASGPLQGLPAMPNQALMFGQMLASGAATANVPILVTSYSQAVKLFGVGSMLARKCYFWFQANAWTPLYVCPQADSGGGTAATGAFTVTAGPTANGTQMFYIDGTQIQVGLTAGMTTAQCATALQQAIAASNSVNLPALPVSSAIDGSNTAKVDLTCLHKGVDAGILDLRLSYYTSDVMVPGLAVTVTPMAGGAGNPSLTAAIAATATAWSMWWDMPYTDGASLSAIATAMEANWVPTVMRDSIAFLAQDVSLSEGATEGESLNEKLFVYLPVQNPPQAPYIWATVAAAIASYFGLQFRPLTTLTMTGLMAPALADRWTPPERNMLNYDGCATYDVDDSGNVTVKRFITTYINNPQGVPDTDFLNCEDVIRAAYLRYSWRVFSASQWPRFNIADDGTKFGVGASVVTPSIIAAGQVGLVRRWEAAGLVTDVDDFIAQQIVERNATDSNRVDTMLPITPVKGLYVEAGQLQLQQ